MSDTFELRNLSVLAYAQGFTLWHYKGASVADAGAAGFFNAADDILATGDMILVSGPTGGSVRIFAPRQDGNAVTVPLS